jgi:lipoprotein-releasing system permease protein
VCGVALATLALVCTLSVFNGFQDMVASFLRHSIRTEDYCYRRKGLDSKITKTIQQLRAMPEVAVFYRNPRRERFVQYKDRQVMAVIKGVQDNFEELTSIDSILYGTGEFVLHDSIVDYGVMGVELVSNLGTGIQFVDPLQVYAPKRNMKVNMANPASSFNMEYLYSRERCLLLINRSTSGIISSSLAFSEIVCYDSEVFL